MRRVVGAVVALVCVALLSSCSLLPSGGMRDDSRGSSDAVMQRIADAVKTHDAAALKRLFSQRAREKAVDLDGGLRDFMAVFPSGQMTWKSEGTTSPGVTDSSGEVVQLDAFYEVSTNGKKYDLFFPDFSVNTKDPDNVGLYALGITPHTTNARTASGKPRPFYVWASNFTLESYTTATPSVYVAQK